MDAGVGQLISGQLLVFCVHPAMARTNKRRHADIVLLAVMRPDIRSFRRSASLIASSLPCE
jgi:hypothetical protein